MSRPGTIYVAPMGSIFYFIFIIIFAIVNLMNKDALVLFLIF